MKGEKQAARQTPKARVIVSPEILAQQPEAQRMMDEWGFVIIEEFAKPGDPGYIGTLRDAQRLFAELVVPPLIRQIGNNQAQ